MNNYELIEVIGEGTYGIVYKCRDRRTDRIVAVKQFKNFQTNAYIRCTMLRELRVEQLLKGEPNVTQLLETFKQKNRLYLVMEYIPRSLLDVLEEHRTGLEEDSLTVLLFTLLLGIQSCHRNGIIHRDVKPENILVRSDGTASLCDFGFCRPVLQQQQQQQQPSSPSRAAKRGLDGRNTSNNSVDALGGAPGSPKLTSSSSLPTHRANAPAASAATSAFLSELVLADHRGVMTDYVATRWYRSPEMLLGMPSYSYAVDMWAVGAIMAEIIDGEPLLPGKTELEQLALIQARIGDFPAAYEAAVRKRNGGMLQLRSSNPLAKPQLRARVQLGVDDGDNGSDNNANAGRDGETTVTISSYLSMRYGGRIKKSGMQLLARLLCVDADGRITVDEALAHPYFESLRRDPRFISSAAPPPSKKETFVEEEAGKEETVERPCRSTASLTDAAAAAPAASGTSLPKLSPTVRTPLTPFFPSSVTAPRHHGSFSKAAASGVDSQLLPRGERSGNAGRLPRATDVDEHAGRPDADMSLSSPGSSSASQSAASSPRLTTLPHVCSASLSPLEGKDAISVFAVASNEHVDEEGSGDERRLDGDSPPPRPAVQQSLPEQSPPLRRHAASEGANGVSTTTAATQATAKGLDRHSSNASHVSTLLFKTKKGRAVMEAVLSHRRSSRDEESAAIGSSSPSTLAAAVSPGAPRLTHGTLAPLRQRRSSEEAAAATAAAPISALDVEEEKTQLDSCRASPPIFAASPSAGKSKGDPVAPSERRMFDKPGVLLHTAEEEEEACVCKSAPRGSGGGGRDRHVTSTGRSSAHRRTSSFTVQGVQHNTVGAGTKQAKKSAKAALRPGLRPANRSATSQDDAVAHSNNNVPTQKRTAPHEVAATERPSAKQHLTSPPRRKTALLHRFSAATTPVSARGAAGAAGDGGSSGRKATTHKAAARRASPDNAAVVIGSEQKRAAVAGGADKSRFASPKLPRVVKPLQPRERMTLLKEIESLGCPVETPREVEVMVSMHSSPIAKERREAGKEDDDVDAGNEEHDEESNSANASTFSASSAEEEEEEEDAAGLLDAGASQLNADGDELFVEDLDNDTVSRSPLLFKTLGLGDVAADSTTATTAAAAQSRPPRADGGCSSTNSHSSRTQPSLYFRSSRTAPAPLKLAAIYLSQGGAPPPPPSQLLPLSSVSGDGGSISTDGASSPSGNVVAFPHASLSTFSPSFGNRPTPTLLRHSHSRTNASQQSPPSLPLDPPTMGGGSVGGGKSVLQPLVSSHGHHSISSRTPREDSPPGPGTSSSLLPHKIGAGCLAEMPPETSPRSSDDAAPTDVHTGPSSQHQQQRRLSANHLSLSLSGEFTHAGNLALSRRSQERLPQLTTATTASLDDVETKVVVETPLVSPDARLHDGGSSPDVATPSRPTREASVVTTQPSVSRTTSSRPQRGSSNRAASAADLTRSRNSAMNSTPSRPRAELVLKRDSDSDDEELPGGARTISFPLPSSGDRSEPPGEAATSSREVPTLDLHPPQPVLGGVWVNVDSSRSGNGLLTVSSRKKSRLIL
ncbi:mitogen-activated protein kinase [Lotmaria passim]